MLQPRIRNLYAAVYNNAAIPEDRNAACAEILNEYERNLIWKAKRLKECITEDIRVFFSQSGKRQVIDRSGKKVRDYYSIAVIVKNEARYIKEFILFHQATGVDRIYIYDNDSTDGLREELEPFLKQYCALFSLDYAAIAGAPFTVVTPDSANPYRQMYVAN